MSGAPHAPGGSALVVGAPTQLWLAHSESQVHVMPFGLGTAHVVNWPAASWLGRIPARCDGRRRIA